MRKSRLYNFYVNPENGSQNTNALAEKYQFKSQFGDQVLHSVSKTDTDSERTYTVTIFPNYSG